MPPTIESSRNPGNTEVWGTGKRDAADEKEEARLLGRYRCVKITHSVLLAFVKY